MTRYSFIVLIILATLANGQNVRVTNASKDFDVEMNPGTCDGMGKCGPVRVYLSRKRSNRPLQSMTVGFIAKQDLATSVQFVDLDFDGHKDLAVFDGIEAPSGYATEAQRIFLYSKRTKRFVFNPEFSEISHRENLLLAEPDRRNRLIYSHGRLGGGVFRERGYRFVKGLPVLVQEVVRDSTYLDATRTKTTTKKLVRGSWRTWTKIVKDRLNT